MANTKDINCSIYEAFIAPYFQDAYRPVRQGDIFIACNGIRQIKFKIIQVDPLEFGIIAQDTVIYYKGEAIWRKANQAIPFAGEIS